MANIKSAKKRIKVSAVRRLQNKSAKSAVKSRVKEFEMTLANDLKQAQEMLPLVLRELDQASAKGLMHKNTVSRRKSRLMKKLNRQTANGS